MHNLHIDVLQQYVDDELPARERIEVARHLGKNAHDSALVDAYQWQNEALQRCYGDKLHEPLPASLQQFVDALEQRPPRPSVALGADASPGDDTHPRLEPLLEQAVQAYQFYGDTTKQSSVYQSHQENEFHQWFQDNLNVRLCSPDFAGQSYSFAHAQHLPMSGGTAGQFAHQHEDGHLVLTYFQVLNDRSPDQQPLTPSVIQRSELALYYWQYEMVLYTLVAAMHQDKLAKLARSLLASMQ